jgi:hypothetical protein
MAIYSHEEGKRDEGYDEEGERDEDKAGQKRSLAMKNIKR